jgi:hypothetical protein
MIAIAIRIWSVLRGIPPIWFAFGLCLAVTAFCWTGWRVDHQRLAACKTGRTADRQAYTDAQVAATKRATEAKRAAESRYAAIEKDKADEIARARAANRADLARWMRAQAAKNNPRSADLPRIADPAPSSDGPITEAVISAADLERCSDAFTVAEGWQSWWRAVSATN